MTTPNLRFSPFTNNWENIKLGEVANTLINNSFSRKMLNYNNGTVQNIHYGDIHTKFQGVLNVSNNKQIPFINSDVDISKILDINYCKNGDLIIADASEDHKGIANATEIMNIGNKKILSGLHTILLRPHNNVFSQAFLSYYFLFQPFKNQMRILATGFKVYGISKTSIKKLTLNIPSIQEQEKIGNFMMLIDRQINILQQQITKLTNYKKTLSTKLLTQAIRFPGFTDEWQTVKLGDICKIKKGKSLSSSNLINGNIPVIAGGKTIPYYHGYSNKTGKTITISASGAYAGYIWLHDYDIWASDCSTISEDKSYNIGYIYYMLKNIQNKIYFLQSGGVQPHIYARDLNILKFNIPSLKEQEKIANVLSNIDKLITRKRNHLTQTLKYKTYLLQNMFI